MLELNKWVHQKRLAKSTIFTPKLKLKRYHYHLLEVTENPESVHLLIFVQTVYSSSIYTVSCSF